MQIDELTVSQAKQLTELFGSHPVATYIPPKFDNPVVAQFIGRFVFVCDLYVDGAYCYLTKVRNVRYWESRENGLGDLAKKGPESGDKIDSWPDQIIPLDKLGPVMAANKDKWT